MCGVAWLGPVVGARRERAVRVCGVGTAQRCLHLSLPCLYQLAVRENWRSEDQDSRAKDAQRNPPANKIRGEEQEPNIGGIAGTGGGGAGGACNRTGEMNEEQARITRHQRPGFPMVLHGVRGDYRLEGLAPLLISTLQFAAQIGARIQG